MNRLTRRRGIAAGALTLAVTTSLLTVAPAGIAAAAAGGASPAYYSGQTQGNALGLSLNLPIKLGPLPNPLNLDLIHLQGQTVHDPLQLVSKTTALANSTASLITGSLVDALANLLHLNLQRTATVHLGGPTQQENSLLSIPAKPLADISVGDLLANLTKVTDGVTSAAEGVVANIGDLNDLLGASTVNSITSLLTQLDLTGKVQTTVNKILDLLKQLTGSNATVSGVVDTVTNTVDTVLNHVTDLVNHLGTTALVSINVHDTHQSVAPDSGGVQALSSLGLIDVNVLGGLLTIDGFHSSAMAFANGKPGGARTSTSAIKPLVTINAADALCAQLDANGISLCNVSGLGLPSTITDAVNKLLKTLSAELTQITSKILGNVPLISASAGTTHTSADGTQAMAVAPSYRIAVGKLLTLTLGDGVAATASAAQAPATTHSKPVRIVSKPTKPLPNTGINLGLIGLGALVLLGSAAMLRRRFGSD